MLAIGFDGFVVSDYGARVPAAAAAAATACQCHATGTQCIAVFETALIVRACVRVWIRLIRLSQMRGST